MFNPEDDKPGMSQPMAEEQAPSGGLRSKLLQQLIEMLTKLPDKGPEGEESPEGGLEIEIGGPGQDHTKNPLGV